MTEPIFAGTPKEIIENGKTITAGYLRKYNFGITVHLKSKILHNYIILTILLGNDIVFHSKILGYRRGYEIID